MQYKITIILDRLRSAHNTGNIFRIADAVGADEIITCGYTPAPPHPKLEKTAMGTDKIIKCRYAENSTIAVDMLRREGCKQIIAVDTAEGAVHAWDFEYQFPLALIFGNEALGVREETIKKCDHVIDLPMVGFKKSINVGNSAAAVLYAILAKNS